MNVCRRVLYVHPTAYQYDGDADPSRPGGMTAIYRHLAADEQRTRQVIADVLGPQRSFAEADLDAIPVTVLTIPAVAYTPTTEPIGLADLVEFFGEDRWRPLSHEQRRQLADAIVALGRMPESDVYGVVAQAAGVDYVDLRTHADAAGAATRPIEDRHTAAAGPSHDRLGRVARRPR